MKPEDVRNTGLSPLKVQIMFLNAGQHMDGSGLRRCAGRFLNPFYPYVVLNPFLRQNEDVAVVLVADPHSIFHLPP